MTFFIYYYDINGFQINEYIPGSLKYLQILRSVNWINKKKALFNRPFEPKGLFIIAIM